MCMELDANQPTDLFMWDLSPVRQAEMQMYIWLEANQPADLLIWDLSPVR